MGLQDGLASLRSANRPIPEPAANELLLKVHAACLNHRDLLALKGQYGAIKPEDRVPLSDGVGTIVGMGNAVSGFSEGQRIVAPHFVSWIDGLYSPAIFAQDLGISRNGWLAEYITIPANAAIVVPDNVNTESAATLAAAATTAWHCMVSFGGLKPSDLVLAPGTGGVSIVTLQLAKAMGAQVAITSSSDEKLETCRAIGADFTVNYCSHSDWPKALLEATGGRAADIVVDTVGLASIEQTIDASAPNGRIALIGGLAGMMDKAPNMSSILGKNLTLKGITSGSRAMMQEMLNLVAEKGIEPLVDSRFASDDAPAAYAHLASGNHMGKVIITFT